MKCIAMKGSAKKSSNNPFKFKLEEERRRDWILRYLACHGLQNLAQTQMV